MLACLWMWVGKCVRVCDIYIFKQLFNFSLYWFLLKFVIIFIGIINNCMSIAVAVSVVEGCVRMCVGNTHKHCYEFYPATVVTSILNFNVCYH